MSESSEDADERSQIIVLDLDLVPASRNVAPWGVRWDTKVQPEIVAAIAIEDILLSGH